MLSRAKQQCDKDLKKCNEQLKLLELDYAGMNKDRRMVPSYMAKDNNL